MSKSYNKWEKFYNQLSMVFHGIIAFSLIPFGWAFLETQREYPEAPFYEGDALLAVKSVCVIICLLVMAGSYRFSQNLLTRAKSLSDVGDKLETYLREKKKDYFLLEVAAIIAFAGLYLTKDHLFSVLYVGVLMMFSTKRPTYHRITRELELKDEEVSDWIARK